MADETGVTGPDSAGAEDSGDTGTRPDDTDTPGADTSGDDTDADDTSGADSGADTWSCESWADPVQTGTVSDGALAELSGIAASTKNPGVLWVLEDSGGDPVVYALDATGASLGSVTFSGVVNHDWEDLDVAPCPDGPGECLWVGDTGDNGLSRDDVTLLTVPEPTVGGGGLAETLAPTAWPYRFPDGRGNVEGFSVGADGLPVLVTKRVDGTADVYRFPMLDAGVRVTVDHVGRVTTGDAADEHPAEATGADISPDGGRLLVRSYGYLLEYPLVDGVPGAPRSLPAPSEPQGEAAAYDAALRGIWLVSEGAHPPLWFVACAAPAQ